MLGKLMKYDMKIQMKLLGILYLVVGLFAGVSAIFEVIDRNFSDSRKVIHTINILTGGLAVLAVIVMLVGSYIYMILRFRKNLFKDEGYLMHTLPVKAWQLYLSKWISATLGFAISVLAAAVALCLAYLHIPNFFDIISGLEASGAPGWYAPMMIFTLLISIPSSFTQFYISLAFGYTVQLNTTSPVNKDLLSVISYVVLYMIQQALGIVMLVVWGLINASAIMDNGLSQGADVVGSMEVVGTDVALAQEQLFHMMGGLFLVSNLFLIAIAVVFSVLSVWRMKKHLNIN